MPFNNEDKIPFKDLPICHQQEIIDVIAGKYNDREVYMNDTVWFKYPPDKNININSIYKVAQKDIVIEIDSFGGIGFDANFLPIPPGKYKLIKIEE